MLQDHKSLDRQSISDILSPHIKCSQLIGHYLQAGKWLDEHTH